MKLSRGEFRSMGKNQAHMTNFSFDDRVGESLGEVLEKSQSPSRQRCRIPQRLGSPRPKAALANKPTNPQVVTKIKGVRDDVAETLQVPQNPRSPRSTRSQSRSRCSTNRSDTASVKQVYVAHTCRPVRLQPTPPKKFPSYKKSFNSLTNKFRPQNYSKLPKLRHLDPGQLPDQETIQRREQQELQDGYQDTEEVSDVAKIQTNWKKNLSQFEALKRDLDIQQKNVMKLYATLRTTHKAMSALGQQVCLPSVEDLRIMNVAKLTPEQLLQLCSDGHPPEDSSQVKISTVDINKFFEMPTKLIATCEMTLNKRKEIIDWFQSLKSEERGISMNRLTKKMNEFTAENEMLACTLNTCKAEFMKELKDVIESLRSGVKETVTLQVRIEELTYEISELNVQNMDLRKQIQSLENMKFSQNKHKLDELEKELKEEKYKKAVIKDRLMRAEGQVKIGNERASQLESALELERSQNRTLERTVQQLKDQNQKLQSDFDKELIKLKKCIKDNTVHLEEIADAREKLQAEKEALEKRLQELSDSYNESLKKLNDELSTNVKKLQETENKFAEETRERKKLESKLESLCAQLFEAEIRYKDGLTQMQVKDEEISKLVIFKCELDATKKSLENAESELQNYKDHSLKLSQNMEELEHNFQDTVNSEKSLKTKLRNKEKYIAELEKNQSLLEQQLHESEHKMELYEKQLNTLKSEIAQVHEEFGEFDNMDQLHDMINEQRDKLLETTRQNGDLANSLQEKELELESCLEQLAEQQQLLNQRDGVIKMITEKEEEQANIIKLLRNNLEMRVKADSELNQQLADKNAEIDALVTNVETRKQQISQFEKIILTLEDQLRKVHLQRRRDQDKMFKLEKALLEYEAIPTDIKHCMEMPVDNLDNLIKMLEDELGTSFDPLQDKTLLKKKFVDERMKCERIEHFPEGENDNQTYSMDEEKVSLNPIQKTPKKCLGTHERDNLGRKKAIMNIETQKWLINSQPQPINIYNSNLDKKMPSMKGMVPMVPVVQVIASQRDDKKGKMFKFAGHNL